MRRRPSPALVLTALCFCLLAAAVVAFPALGHPTTSGLQANESPRVTIERAAIGRFYEEGRGKRPGMLHFRFRICDDGPENEYPERYARISITHRWGSRSRESLMVRETHDLISYDIYFSRRECVGNIPHTSSVPADLAYARMYACYAISVRVRDPAGKWSNHATRVLRRCRPGAQ